MKRDIQQKLVEWKASKLRKPLILKGARQVGKTWVLKQFGTEAYQNMIYINFDENPECKDFFTKDLNPERILKDLSLYSNQPILPATTLIVFDEIQESPEALNSLKYFCEEKNEYHVATAGSLLGVKLTKGFPVGKVNFIELTPLTFYEFLTAMNEDKLRQMLESMDEVQAIAKPLHSKLVEVLKKYFIIGGMPEAINTYNTTHSFADVRVEQKAILDAYTLDFAKHAPKDQLMKIMQVWEQVPSQLAKENKKFIFSAIKKSARAREYEDAIQWLVDAGLILKTYNVMTPKLPLKSYANHQAFKIYSLDVGLLGAQSKLDPVVTLQENKLFMEFKGALTENYVAQELRYKFSEDIYYWTSTGEAEVDFLIATQQTIYPLEVKSGENKKKKSLLVYADKYHDEAYQSSYISRTTLLNFAKDGRVVNYPLYAIALFPK